jgi:hypothetical protein
LAELTLKVIGLLEEKIETTHSMIEQAEYNRTDHYDETNANNANNANNMLQLNLIADKLYEVMEIMRRLKAPIHRPGR